jgi:glutathione S-transferase
MSASRPTLVIGNKRYSSWSLRPWLLLRQSGIDFDEVVIPLYEHGYKAAILAHSPTGKVPVLIDRLVTVWETVAIMEHAGEAYGASVWPAHPEARATARAVSAEMHAGFLALRSSCPMNLGKRFAARDRGTEVAQNVARFETIVSDSRNRFGEGGPFLFGAFSAADAMYAPLVTRIDTYSIPVAPQTRAYMDAVLKLPAFREWRDAALGEPWTIARVELDETPIAVFA